MTGSWLSFPEIGGELVERRRPAVGVRLAGGRGDEILLVKAHLGAVTPRDEAHGDQRGRCQRAVGAHPGVGEGEPLGLADLAIDADLGLDGAGLVRPDAHAPGAALAQVERAGQHREAARRPPVLHVLGLDEGAEDRQSWCVEAARQREVADRLQRVICVCGHASFLSPGRPGAYQAADPKSGGSPTPIPAPRAAAPPPGGTAGGGGAGPARGGGWASRPRASRPARSSTFRCLGFAGRVMSNGWASSPTALSPSASRARMARRVGSLRAYSVVLSRWGSLLNIL